MMKGVPGLDSYLDPPEDPDCPECWPEECSCDCELIEPVVMADRNKEFGGTNYRDRGEENG